jgi:tRNA (cmo5U34)-methyltransferase
MADRWTDPEFAAAWDRAADAGNPARAEQIDLLTRIVARTYRPGSAILDLGAGSGQVTQRILAALPEGRIVAVDSSPAMMELARRRLSEAGDRVVFVHGNLADLSTIALPRADYQIALLVQVMHHIPHPAKRRLLEHLHSLLPSDGIVIVVDRVRLEPTSLVPIFEATWEWEESRAAQRSGWDAATFRGRMAAKDDYPVSLEALLAMLREAGFAAACIHLRLNRAFLAATR